MYCRIVANSSMQANFDLPASLLQTVRHMRNKNQFLLLIAFIACIVSGCSGSDKPPSYVNVSGNVTFDGKPLTDATIVFNTDGRPPSQIPIVDGVYNGQAMIGSNRVSITARRKGAAGNSHVSEADKARIAGMAKAMASQGGAPDEGEEIIPADYGANTKQVRVIESGVQNKFDFDIKIKK